MYTNVQSYTGKDIELLYTMTTSTSHNSKSTAAVINHLTELFFAVARNGGS